MKNTLSFHDFVLYHVGLADDIEVKIVTYICDDDDDQKFSPPTSFLPTCTYMYLFIFQIILWLGKSHFGESKQNQHPL